MDPKFSGTITDSLGRKVHFQNGVRVAGPQDVKGSEKPLELKPVKDNPEGPTHAPVGVIEPNQSKEQSLKPSESFTANVPQSTYVSLDEQKRIGGVLGIDSWVLRKVSERDVQKLDAIASRLRDPEQKRALEDVINRIDNAVMNGGGYSFIPKGTIRPGANRPKPLPLGVGGLRGVENTKPVEPSEKVPLTHSILSHRSPKNKTTDRKRSKGETAYSNILHNQVEPTPEEWKALGSDLPKLGRDQLNRLVRRFKVNIDREKSRSVSQLRKGIEDHIKDITEYGAQGTGVPPELGKDRRSGKHQNEAFTQFRPVRNY